MAQTDIKIIVEAVDQATKTLESVKTSLGGLDNVTKWVAWSVDKLSDRFTNMWKISRTEVAAAWTAISGWILYAITNVTKEFWLFESTMSGVRAVLNPTNEEFKKASELALELGASSRYTAQEAAAMQEMLAKNGVTMTQILDGAAKSSLDLAAATGANLPEAADIASSALLVFNKQLKDLPQVVNSITGTTNISKFSIQDYALAMAQGGGAASAFWVSLEDFNSSIAAISPLFQSGSDAGTSYKTFLQRLVPASDSAQDAMKKLGIMTKDGSNRFFDATGKMKSMADISQILKDATKNLSDEQKISSLSTIFGTDAMRAAAWMAKIGSEEFKKMSKEIEGTNAAENAKTRMDNLKGAIEKMNGSISTAKILLGQALAPALALGAKAVEFIADKITWLINWVNWLPEPVGNAIKLIAWITVGMVALGAVIAVAVVSLSWVWAAFLAIASATAPFIGIATAIWWAIYALYIWFEQNTGWIRDAWNGLMTTLSGLWNQHGGYIKESIRVFWDYVQMIWKIGVEMIKIIFTQGMTVIAGILTVFDGILSWSWTKIWAWIKTIFSWAWNAIWQTAQSIMGSIIDFIASAIWVDLMTKIAEWILKIEQEFQVFLGNVQWYFSGLVDSAKAWGGNMIQMFVDGIKEKVAALKAGIAQIATDISDYLGFHSPTKKWPWKDADKWMPNLIKMLGDGLASGRTVIDSRAKEISVALWKIGEKFSISTISSTLSSIADKAKSAFSNVTADIEKSVEKVKTLKSELESINTKIKELNDSKITTNKDWRWEIANRAVEIEKELAGLKKQDKLSSEDIVKMNQLERELELSRRTITQEEYRSALIESEKSETQKIIDKMVQKQVEIDKEIVKLQQLKIQKESDIKEEENLQKNLSATKIKLENQYYSLYKEHIEWVKTGISEAITLMTRLNILRNWPLLGAPTISWARASGGPVSSGKTYLVWERWPELFTADKSGTIIPNNKLWGNGWMSLTLSFWDVHITNGMNMEDFTKKIKDTIYKEFRSARLWL
jgi:TP901 family phage tail tape measure protein